MTQFVKMTVSQDVVVIAVVDVVEVAATLAAVVAVLTVAEHVKDHAVMDVPVAVLMV